ncbi:MAG: hypothetical protein Q8N21_01650 [bacterium]|nr:hypothetical protein [bacterium]
MKEKMPIGVPTPKERAELEKSYAISDAELLKNGASYEFNNKGEKILNATEDQKKEIYCDFERKAKEKVEAEKLEKLSQLISEFFKSNKVKKLDSIFITTKGGSGQSYKFHSLDGGNLNIIDTGSGYGGTADFMRKMVERGDSAIKNDKWTDSIGVDNIKQIQTDDFKNELILPDRNKI